MFPIHRVFLNQWQYSHYFHRYMDVTKNSSESEKKIINITGYFIYRDLSHYFYQQWIRNFVPLKEYELKKRSQTQTPPSAFIKHFFIDANGSFWNEHFYRY